MKIFLKSIFWVASFFFTLLILISAYYFAFFFNFFGTLETAGKNLNKPYPDYLLQSKIQSQLKLATQKIDFKNIFICVFLPLFLILQ